MAWSLENFVKTVTDVSATTTGIVTQASSIMNKVKGFSLPTIGTTTGTPGAVEMTSGGQPGAALSVGSITASSAMPYLLLGGVVVVALVLWRK